MPFNTGSTVWNISADHIAQQNGRYEPQRTNNFMLTIPDIPGGGTEVLRLAIQSAFAPIETHDVLEIKYINETIKVPGAITYEQGTVTFIDYVDPETGTALFTWRRMIHDPYTGRGGLCRDFKRDCLLQLFGPSGGGAREWTLRGCWPSSVNWASALDFNSVDVNRIEVTLVYDKAFPLHEGHRSEILNGWLPVGTSAGGRSGNASSTIG